MTFDGTLQEYLLTFLKMLLSLVITVLAYGTFPLIFAGVRKKPITKKMYRGICIVINAISMFLLSFLNETVSSGLAYVLWTFVFSTAGIKTLEKKEILIVKKVYVCKNCGKELGRKKQVCPNCGANTSELKISTSVSDGTNN